MFLRKLRERVWPKPAASLFQAPEDELEMFQLLRCLGGPYAKYLYRISYQRYDVEDALRIGLAPEPFCTDIDGDTVFLDWGEEWRAAQVLVDASRDIFPVRRHRQGNKDIEQLLDDIQYCRKVLPERWPEPITFQADWPPELAQLLLQHAFAAPSLDQALNRLDGLASAIRDMTKHRKPRETRRAFEVALALRAVFEHYSEFPIAVAQLRSSGPPILEKPTYEVSSARHYATGEPKSRFMLTLAKIFEALEIEATLHHYADRAKRTPPDDPLLQSMRLKLRAKTSNQTQYPLILTEFGWVKNLRAPEELRQLYEDFYSYKEVKAWQSRSLRTKGSMMTQIRNWIS